MKEKKSSKFSKKTQVKKLQLLDELTQALDLNPQDIVEYWLDNGKISPLPNKESDDNTSETDATALSRRSEEPTLKPYHANHTPVDLNSPEDREIYDIVVAILAEELSLERNDNISLETSLVKDLGAYEMDKYGIAGSFRQKFSLPIFESEIPLLHTVEDWVAFLRDKKKSVAEYRDLAPLCSQDLDGNQILSRE